MTFEQNHTLHSTHLSYLWKERAAQTDEELQGLLRSSYWNMQPRPCKCYCGLSVHIHGNLPARDYVTVLVGTRFLPSMLNHSTAFLRRVMERERTQPREQATSSYETVG